MVVVVISVRWNVRRYAGHAVDGSSGKTRPSAISAVLQFDLFRAPWLDEYSSDGTVYGPDMI